MSTPEPEPRNLLLIAAREPMPGFTKTRLGAAIGMERAAALYRAFLADLGDEFAPWRGGDGPRLGWACTPDPVRFQTTLADLCPAAATGDVLFVPQLGGDWAAGQTHLLHWGAEHGYARTVLTASDSPHLSRGIIRDAFRVLEEREIVLGRVHDGGYYLIGCRGFHDVLSGVAMSTASAADGVVTRARALGLRVGETAPLFDIDTAEDLPRLSRFVQRHPAAIPHTARALLALGLDPPDPAEPWRHARPGSAGGTGAVLPAAASAAPMPGAPG